MSNPSEPFSHLVGFDDAPFSRQWALIERAGPMEPLAGVYVQRCGIGAPAAETLIRNAATNGKLPEPLRTAHLIAGGIGLGESRHRA